MISNKGFDYKDKQMYISSSKEEKGTHIRYEEEGMVKLHTVNSLETDISTGLKTIKSTLYFALEMLVTVFDATKRLLVDKNSTVLVDADNIYQSEITTLVALNEVCKVEYGFALISDTNRVVDQPTVVEVTDYNTDGKLTYQIHNQELDSSVLLKINDNPEEPVSTDNKITLVDGLNKIQFITQFSQGDKTVLDIIGYKEPTT